MPLGRRVTNALASAAVGAIVGVSVPDAQSGYRAIRREVLADVRASGDRYEYETEFLIAAVRAGYRLGSIGVPTTYGAPSHFRSVGRLHARGASDLAAARARGELMRLLCTNDDGILAHGLECLVKAAEMLGDVTVVAPDREQSATSHSLTLHHPIRPVTRGERRWQVDGTPTDCVMLAVEALMPVRPDFVLSGINHGQNMGEDVLYSGTVAAAMEGVTLGVPAIALSFAGGELKADPALLTDHVPAVAALLAASHCTRAAARYAAQREHACAARSKIRGVRLTRLGRRVYSDSLMKMQDPRKREIYWIGGGSASWSGAEDSDFRAVEDGFISVTPLTLDLTHLRMLDEAKLWWSEP